MSGGVNVYHGTNENFEVFNFSKVGLNNGLRAGFGIYFTEVEAEAFVYGDNVFECVLNLKTPLHNEIITLKENDLIKIIDKVIDNGGNDYYENFDYSSQSIAIEHLLNCSESDTEIIGDLVNSGVGLDILMKSLTELGYTHTIDMKEADDKLCTHYIVYDLNAISIINKYTLETR